MPLISQSRYLTNLKRLDEDINSLIWYTEQDDPKNANIRASYITKEVELLVELVKHFKEK